MWKWFKRIVAGLVLACFGLILLLSIPSVRTHLDSYGWFLDWHIDAIFDWERWNSLRAKPIEPIDPEEVLRRFLDPTPVELALDQQWDGVEYLGEEAVEPLLSLLFDGFNEWQRGVYNPQSNREKAIERLSSIGPPAVPKLIAALDSKDPAIRTGAAQALSQIKDVRIVTPMAKLLDEEYAAVRFSAAVGLAINGDGRGLGEIARQMEANPESFYISWKGKYALAALATPEACRVVFRDIRNNTKRWIKNVMNPCAPHLVPELIEALGDTESEIFPDLLKKLSEIGDDRVIEIFISLLHHKEESIRSAAIRTLGKFRVFEAVNEIIDTEVTESESSKVQALAQIADPCATVHILHAGKKDFVSWSTTIRAIAAIGDIQGIKRWLEWIPWQKCTNMPNEYCNFKTSDNDLLHIRDLAVPIARQVLRNSKGEFNLIAMRVLANGKDLQALELLLTPPRKFECADDFLCFYLTLGKYKDPRAQKILSKALEQVTNFEIYKQLLPALKRSGDPLIVTKLVDWIIPAKDYSLKKTTVGINTKAEDDQRWRNKILNYLDGDFRKLNSEQARYLGTITNPNLIDPLSEALRHANPVVQTCAAEALRHIDDPQARKALDEARAAGGGWRGQLWWWQERHIEKTDDPKALIRLLSHKDWRVREAAIQALVLLGSQATASLQLYLLQHSSLSREIYHSYSVTIRRDDRIGLAGAATALGEIGDQRAIRSLKYLPRSDNWLVAQRATEALAKLQPETEEVSQSETETTSIQGLLRKLDHLEASVRYDAAMALVRIGSEAVPPLINLLENGRRIEAAEAAFALGRIDDERAFAPLVKALSHSDVRVRARAAEALGWHGDRRAIAELERFRVGKEGWEQLAADWALERLRGETDSGEEI